MRRCSLAVCALLAATAAVPAGLVFPQAASAGARASGSDIMTVTRPAGQAALRTVTTRWRSQAADLTVRRSTEFRRVRIRLSVFRILRVRACLVVISPGKSGPPVNDPVTLQYARSANAPWKKLSTIWPTSGLDYCGAGSPVWRAAVTAPAPDAYYRLRFAGHRDLRASVSKVLRRRRALTRITSLTVSPRRVPARGAITISGRLWRLGVSWHPYVGRRVAIQFLYRGVLYQFSAEPRTSSGGYFSGRFTVYGTSKWIAKYLGDRRHFGCASPRIKVTVTSTSAPPLPRPVRPAP